MPVYKRIEFILSYFKLTQKQLASKAGLSENTISNAKKGGNVPNVNFFNSIFLAFPNIEPQWLYLGIGKMLIDEDYNELFSYKVESNYQMDCLKKINSLEKIINS